MYPESVYCAGLLSLEAISQKRLESLYRMCGTWEKSWHASQAQMSATGLDETRARACVSARDRLNLDHIAALCARDSIRMVGRDDPSYPSLLQEIHDPPFALFVRGILPEADRLCVGILGTRRITPYGQAAIRVLVSELARVGVCIVSGLAFGVDVYAHAVTLEHKGMTMAVLASGVNGEHIGPQTNRPLAENILRRGGCIISEQAPGMRPRPYHFPLRNRIVAGMCKAVVVIEAGIRSGSLITAESALRENREVFAVPGPITSEYSQGTNDLLRRGAHIATCAADILEHYTLVPECQKEHQKP